MLESGSIRFSHDSAPFCPGFRILNDLLQRLGSPIIRSVQSKGDPSLRPGSFECNRVLRHLDY